MKNVVRVTSHLRRKLQTLDAKDITRRLSDPLFPPREGQSFYRNGAGECWRTFVFVEGVQTFESSNSPQQAFQAGKAFGFFQSLLVDLPGPRLAETIPHFHHTRKRFQAFQKAVQKDHFNRAQAAKS